MRHDCPKDTHNARQWNPPSIPSGTKLPLEESQPVVSATECTGLTQQPVTSESECADYADLYAIHALKPQGNPGKGNPRNDPEEIAFHRK